jgi:hypothetical protein
MHPSALSLAHCLLAHGFCLGLEQVDGKQKPYIVTGLDQNGTAAKSGAIALGYFLCSSLSRLALNPACMSYRKVLFQLSETIALLLFCALL